MSKADWQKVFKFTAATAKDMCEKNPSLTYPKAMKRAWKDPRVLIKRKEYEKKKAAIKMKMTKSKKTTKKVIKSVAKKDTNKIKPDAKEKHEKKSEKSEKGEKHEKGEKGDKAKKEASKKIVTKTALKVTPKTVAKK